MAAAASIPLEMPVRRKPPASEQCREQFNWISGRYESLPEQLELELPVADDAILPGDDTVTLLATESGAQLLVAGFGLYIGKKGERIVVKQHGKICAQVPFMRAQEVVIASRGVSFSSDLLEELCARGIRVGCMSSSGKPIALITSPLLTATVETRRKQLAANGNERGAEFCRWIVAGKLRNQEKLLRYFGKSREGERREALEKAAATLRRLRKDALDVAGGSADEVRGSLLGLEGTGGRIYWQRIADMLPDELGFGGRRHQGPGDAVNAALNYGYGILYTHVWGAVMNAGLEPFAGFMHVDRSGKPSMVLDMVEEFRQPVVDRAILTWLNKGGRLGMTASGHDKGMLDGETRENVAARVLLRMNATERHRGKSHEIRSIIQMQARMAASALRGLREYRPFAFQW